MQQMMASGTKNSLPHSAITALDPHNDSSLVEARCKKYACAYQDCLAKHNHSDDRCRFHYDNYERCATAVRARLLSQQQRDEQQGGTSAVVATKRV